MTADPAALTTALTAIAAAASDNERDRRLGADTVEQLLSTGVFSALVPASLGGGEVEPAEFVASVERIAGADGAAGWCGAIGATAGLAAAYLPEDLAAELFLPPSGSRGDGPAIAAGVFAPRGRLTSAEDATDHGFVLEGRWQLASGISHAEVVGLGCIHPEAGPRYAVVPRARIEVLETWDSLGLRATASHDVAVGGLAVPAEAVVDLAGGEPTASGPLYSFPLFGLLALSVSAVCTGIAVAALADARAAASARKPAGSSRSLAERGTVQENVAVGEASLRAARAGVAAAVDEAWDAARGGDPLSVELRVGLRLAATHAARTAVDAVDLAHRLSGAAGLYAGTAERRLRDVHTAAQHMIVAPATLELAGRILLDASDGDRDLSQL